MCISSLCDCTLCDVGLLTAVCMLRRCTGARESAIITLRAPPRHLCWSGMRCVPLQSLPPRSRSFVLARALHCTIVRADASGERISVLLVAPGAMPTPQPRR